MYISTSWKLIHNLNTFLNPKTVSRNEKNKILIYSISKS
ncbi:hypothetical protein EU93_0337 [Prochlorococcus marinus str. MIT 9116]|uniref:Uncharacterized protein n=1 Tax=Prochlorococcus marinus str. MIT 9116 TaxID=167544 RepID=A0A0A1ZX72_PROMR|nr:hypothetical protein EU93_0337 [Prochlorococcus marinus str. MIT 9116]